MNLEPQVTAAYSPDLITLGPQVAHQLHPLVRDLQKRVHLGQQ
jgi:hypothetical protein